MKQMLLAILFLIPLSVVAAVDSRKIEVDVSLAGNRLWTVKSEFLVQAPPEKLWHIVVADVDHWSEFIPHILFSRVVSRNLANQIVKQASTEWKDVEPLLQNENLPIQSRLDFTRPNEMTMFKVLLMNLPWPVANRWVLQRDQDRYNPATQSYVRRFELVTGNVVVAEGYWRARPHPQNPAWSLVYYENSYDAGFQVPEVVFRPLIRRDTKKIMEAVRKRAEGQYK